MLLGELVPKDHLVRKIDKAVDFNFIFDLCNRNNWENTASNTIGNMPAIPVRRNSTYTGKPQTAMASLNIAAVQSNALTVLAKANA